MAIFTLTFPWQQAQADTGPKPSLDFVIEYSIDPLPELVSGFMMTCTNENCIEAQVFGLGLILPFR